MASARLGMRRLVCLLALSALVFLPGLGRSGRLSYHEAFVAQGAREMLDSGVWGYPTIGGLPWLEKPPMPWWLVAGLGWCAGGVDETVARLPSVIAATLLVVGVAVAATRYYGSGVGVLAGAVQATTAWSAMRGRLAEADMLLACLITWAIVAFDRMSQSDAEGDARASGWRRARWGFFVLLGATSLVKGVGFGAALILAVVGATVLWRGDGAAARRLRFPAGWIVAAGMALAWPMAMVAWHGWGALLLWTTHVTDRLAAQPTEFAGEPWWQYVPGLVFQAMPWTPLAVIGAWHSLRRAISSPGRLPDPSPATISSGSSPAPRHSPPATRPAGDRLLWAWSLAPLALLSLATVKNAHYAIAAQVPWSIWAAMGLTWVGNRLVRRGWTIERVRRRAIVGFAAMGVCYGLGCWFLGPMFDRRGIEWAFYESVGRQIPPGASVALVYDDWDRNPYESPFGAFPHDLAVRLFYLGRPASWRAVVDHLVAHGLTPLEKGVGLGSPATSYVIGRDRDRPVLEQLGDLEVVDRGPNIRKDRTYTLFRLKPAAERATLDADAPIASAEGQGIQR